MCIQGDDGELPLHQHLMERYPQVLAPLIALKRVTKRERRSGERRSPPALHLLKVHLIHGVPPLQMLIQGNHANVSDLSISAKTPTLHCDSQSAIMLAKNPVFHAKTKHISAKHHFIQDVLEDKHMQLVKAHIDDNLADLLTKGLPS
ncbi:hypothetical protein L7F22_063796 [Adiantum nelumboides]|nr:hypothetical protein [Adiantum nelumboides]